jgi:hypothetical protein
MAFKKGQSGNPNGRGVGVLSEKVKAWEQLGDFITDAGAIRVKQILATCDEETFLKYYGQFMEYFKPKLSRSEAKVDASLNMQGSLTIQVLNESDNEAINKL